MASRQTTIRKLLKFSGVGLQTGIASNIALHPAAKDTGISFVVDNIRIPATFENVVDTQTCLKLRAPSTAHYRSPVCITTVEHLLAAISAADIDNVIVHVSSNEIPIMDGSSSPFSTAFRGNVVNIPNSQKHRVIVRKPISVKTPDPDGRGTRVAVLAPSAFNRLTFDVAIDYDQRIREGCGSRQRFEFSLSYGTFSHSVARARAFYFRDHLESMRARGLALGCNLDNTIVFGAQGKSVNPDGLRYNDEPCRRKLLNCIADLRLGGHLIGHYIANKPEHSLNLALLRHMYKDPSNYYLE